MAFERICTPADGGTFTVKAYNFTIEDLESEFSEGVKSGVYYICTAAANPGYRFKGWYVEYDFIQIGASGNEVSRESSHLETNVNPTKSPSNTTHPDDVISDWVSKEYEGFGKFKRVITRITAIFEKIEVAYHGLLRHADKNLLLNINNSLVRGSGFKS